MAFHPCTAKVILWFLLYFFVNAPRSQSFQQTKHRRTTTGKAHDRFARWTDNRNQQHNDETEKLRFLWIDGNNVRGFGNFEWNAVELQHMVVRFCHKYKIPNAIIVWDHGSHKFAHSTKYSFDDSGKEVPIAVVAETDHHDSIFCVNLVVLFSGLRQRADDVLVNESNHLVASSFRDGCNSNSTIDWASLAFVTNDRELNYKLRQKAAPRSPSIRLSRRKRRDHGKIFDQSIGQTSTSALGGELNPETTTAAAAANSLFCDSKGFLDLLCELPGEYDKEMNLIDTMASESIEKAKASIRRCSKSQRRRYNPRREKTWERCVQAETFRRCLSESSCVEKEEPSAIEPTCTLEDESVVFVSNYLQELHSARGYSGIVQGKRNDNNDSDSDAIENQFSPFLGPARLDKHQRRTLDRYNALIRNSEST